ncbi:MAG TPA: sulfatase-like hydrolase/transferase, partial [Candidatus Hydrogenedentes bacterium]|nr:sulfatase-like hydrolase/transferase [Candidatus Hydrogenedentota bacterium]
MAGAAALAAARRGATASAAAKPPNIIFILADDLGYGDVGCYGQEQVLTPRIDAMAAEGVRFTQCYAGSTVCAPSRCCLMTGMHTGHARIRGNDRVPLEPGDTTVAEVLRGAGYETALIGKWGLGNPDTTGIPTRQGFDHFFGFLDQKHAHNHYPDYLWENETRVDIPENVQHEKYEGVCAQCETFADDLFTEKALAFIEKDRDRPFFLYLSHVIPHANNERG